jgi:hypothetical protein
MLVALIRRIAVVVVSSFDVSFSVCAIVALEMGSFLLKLRVLTIAPGTMLCE